MGRTLALAFLLALLPVAILACVDDPPPAMPGHRVPYAVESRWLPATAPSILAARSRDGLLATYFGVPPEQGDGSCSRRYPGAPTMCWRDLVKPEGSIWVLVDPRGDCTHDSRVDSVTLKGSTIYVGVWVHPVDCPRGAETQALPTFRLVTVPPLPTTLTTASVVYSGAESRNNASTPIGD